MTADGTAPHCRVKLQISLTGESWEMWFQTLFHVLDS